MGAYAAPAQRRVCLPGRVLFGVRCCLRDRRTLGTGLARLLAVVAVALGPVPLVAGQPADQRFPPPTVKRPTVALSRHTFVIPDPEVVLIPSIGIVVGDRATLVVDTGIGPRNGRTVRREVARVSTNRRLYLTVTHFHPDHASGLTALSPPGTFIVSRALQRDLDTFGAQAIAATARFTPVIARLLKDVVLPRPDIVFDGEHVLDLGGIHVRLVPVGPAHTAGDTVVFVEEDQILFAGDLVFARRFPSVPAGARATDWFAMFDRLAALKPRLVVPGHGALGGADLIEKQRAMLQEIQRRVEVLKAEGRSAASVSHQVDLEFQERYPEWKATYPNELVPIAESLFGE